MLMTKSPKFIFTGVVAIGLIVAVLHAVASYFYLYWEIAWLDMFAHFLGGAWIALLFVWLFSFWKLARRNSQIFIFCFFVTLIVGILWEIFEFFTGTSGGPLDTASDIFFDLLGALASAFYLIRNKVLEHGTN